MDTAVPEDLEVLRSAAEEFLREEETVRRLAQLREMLHSTEVDQPLAMSSADVDLEQAGKNLPDEGGAAAVGCGDDSPVVMALAVSQQPPPTSVVQQPALPEAVFVTSRPAAERYTAEDKQAMISGRQCLAEAAAHRATAAAAAAAARRSPATDHSGEDFLRSEAASLEMGLRTLMGMRKRGAPHEQAHLKTQLEVAMDRLEVVKREIGEGPGRPRRASGGV